MFLDEKNTTYDDVVRVCGQQGVAFRRIQRGAFGTTTGATKVVGVGERELQSIVCEVRPVGPMSVYGLFSSY